MIYMVIFDLDGVLSDTPDLHYRALNTALEELAPTFKITKDDHNDHYNGLPTIKKLHLLVEKGMPPNLVSPINKRKQEVTKKLVDHLQPYPRHVKMLSRLREEYYLACASNATIESINQILNKLNLRHFFHIVKSGTSCPKPNPKIYLDCMADFVCAPQNTLIIEDSPIGLEGARASEAHVLEADYSSVTYQLINSTIQKINRGE